jgi:hypothetical protein
MPNTVVVGYVSQIAEASRWTQRQIRFFRYLFTSMNKLAANVRHELPRLIVSEPLGA